MIAAIVIPLYFAIGVAVSRWTALRRRSNGRWECAEDEDNYIACGLALFGWPLAAAMYLVTAPPKEKRLERMKREIAEMEKELGVS